MDSNHWTRLSFSSKRAFFWASAIANLRAAESSIPPTVIQISAFDILVGMLLEHPKDAEPKILLDHFQLTPGQVLPPDYPRLSKESLERHLPFVSPESAMFLDPDTQNILEIGIKLGLSTGSSEVVELRALFGGMLETSNPVSSRLMSIFEGIGVTFSEVNQTTNEFILKGWGKESYAEFLSTQHPFTPRPVDIPNYKADHGHDHQLTDDMVGIRSEVDAFAYLLASRGLLPPLAVGLFGDWGSGKSFFMKSVRQRIEQLTHDPNVLEKKQFEVPFWKRIIQIEFNAWHYMEGELWASLVDHIFDQLRMKGDTEDLVKKRRDHWLGKIDHTRAELIRLESKRKNAQSDLTAKQKAAEHLNIQRESEIEKLEELKNQATRDVLIKSSLEEVQAVLDKPLLSVGLPASKEVLQSLEETKTELKRARALFGRLWGDPKGRQAVIGALIGIPALLILLSLIDVSGVAAAFSGISASAAAALTLFGKSVGMMKSRMDKLETATENVNREIEAARKALDEKILASEKLISTADDELKSIMDEQHNLTKDLKDYREKLENVTPTRVLTDFVTERVGSGDYRKVLGIPALIQQDFEQLANLVKEQNTEILDKKNSKLEQSSETFNRIILYIDDLDRCPDDHVVKVLQAVHLLLAFDLFVVVVAVDSRWLSHALTKHFEALAVSATNGTGATPDDYLEKIFQIPFWIQPLDDSAKQNIIQGLLRGHLTGEDGRETEASDVEIPKVEAEQVKVLNTLNPSGAPPLLQTAALSITRAELNFLDELVPVLGSTPRSTKRFVNLYQLARIIYQLDPEEDPDSEPQEYELMAFVLALGEGLPKLGPLVLKEAVKAKTNDLFDSVIQKIKPEADGREVQRLEAWLTHRESWKQIPASRIADAYGKINRFLFRVGTINEKHRD